MTRLHNFIIDTDGLQHLLTENNDIPIAWTGNNLLTSAFLPIPPVPFEQGNCARRDAIVNQLKEKTMKRPQWNIDYNVGGEVRETNTDYEYSEE